MTVTYPFSAICSLEIVNSNLEKFYGTGFLAGPRLVLTAGHNVYFHGEDFMKQITVYPGLNADRGNPRLRSTKAHRLLTVESWVNDADQQFDFGAIVLPTDLGHEAGWFSISNFTESTLASMTVTIAGYPQHPPSDSSPRDASTLWHHNGRIERVEPNRLLYQIDTSTGQSGAPLIAFFPEKDNSFQAVGVHNTAFGSSNAATRINDPVFSQIVK